jgi:hypothetical protein
MIPARLLRIAVVGFLLAAAVATAHAGTARRIALGGDVGYEPDADEARRWYASLVDHPDRFFFEFGELLAAGGSRVPDPGMIGHGGGVQVRLAADPRWGTASVAFEDGQEHGSNDGAFGLGWARRFGCVDVGLGGRFTTFGESSTGTEAGDRVDAQYFHQYGFGLRGAPRHDLTVELAGEIINSMAESHDAVHHLNATSTWSSFGLRARCSLAVTAELRLVPQVDHFRDSRPAFDDQLAGPADLDARLTRLGLAVLLQRDPRTLVIIGAEYREGRDDRRARTAESVDFARTSKERSFYHLRGRCAVEAALRPWLTLRAAITYVRADDKERLNLSTAETVAEARLETTVATPLSLGLGVQWAGWTLDLAWNDSAPLNDGLTASGPLAGIASGYSALSLACAF